MPTATILPSAIAIESPSSRGFAMSPDTICPMFLISVFKDSSWHSSYPSPLRGEGRVRGGFSQPGHTVRYFRRSASSAMSWVMGPSKRISPFSMM